MVSKQFNGGSLTESMRVSFVITVLNWLTESPYQKATNVTPGYMSAAMARKCYFNCIFLETRLTVFQLLLLAL